MKTESWSRTHPDGSRSEGTLVAGLPGGFYREYFPTGEIRKEYQFERGLQHGLQRQFSRDGRCICEFTVIYGTGVFLEVWDDGRPKSRRELEGDIDGFTGIERVFDTSGKLAGTAYLVRGKTVTKKKYEAYKK